MNAISSRLTFWVTILVLTVCAALASAQPPTLDTIDFPIDVASIGTAVGAAGAVILLVVFGYKGGFKLVWKTFNRLLKFI